MNATINTCRVFIPTKQLSCIIYKKSQNNDICIKEVNRPGVIATLYTLFFKLTFRYSRIFLVKLFYSTKLYVIYTNNFVILGNNYITIEAVIGKRLLNYRSVVLY